MAVSAIAPISLDLNRSSDMPAAVATTGDMDIDMDLDLGLVEDLGAMDTGIIDTEAQASGNQPSFEVFSPSDLDASNITPYKVHLRGLDNLRTTDIKTFASDHYPDKPCLRVEWIDDASANLVYDTAETAASALASFSSVQADQLSSLSSLQLRAAKPLSTHPDAKLEVRLAVAQDRKMPGARERSRFYLFNPDEDLGERRYRERDRRRHGRPDRDGDHGDYRRRRYDRSEQNRRRNEDQDGGFDATMYDDDAGSSGQATSSTRSERARHRRSARFNNSTSGRELFSDRAGRGTGWSRDRSASPERGPHGDESMDVDDARSRQHRFRERSRSPRDRDRSRRVDSRGSQGHSTAMDTSTSTQVVPRDISAELRGHTKATRGGMELFPQKAGIRQHRRSDAFDAADETADLFAGRMSVPFTDGSADRRGVSVLTKAKKSGILSENDDFSSRISLPAMDVEQAPTHAAPPLPSSEATQDTGGSRTGGFQIRGAAASSEVFHHQHQQQKKNTQGFSIRGTAAASGAGNESFGNKDRSDHGSGNEARITKELFPQKNKINPGEDLFSEKIQGRGRRRRKAEDMFY